MTEDPTIKQRIEILMKINRNPQKELIAHMATEQSNEEIIGLHVLGESVFDKERKFARKLVKDAEHAEQVRPVPYNWRSILEPEEIVWHNIPEVADEDPAEESDI